MADNSFRTFRRDALAPDPAQRDSVADPLAELARLIGQNDPHGAPGRDAGLPAEGYDDTAAPAAELDWAAADEDYPQQSHEAEESSVAPRSAEPYRQHPSDVAPWPRDRDYEDEPAVARQYVPPASAADDARGDSRLNLGLHDAHYRDEPRPVASRTQPLPYIPPAPGAHPAGEQGQYGTPAAAATGDYGRDEYDEEAPPPRRSGTIVIVALLGFAVLGTAGALGYRAMFGGSVIPSLPPIIKPGNTPVKIMPNHETQAGAPSQAAAGTKATGEQLVKHEEQPVDIQSANPVPRVVTTIPVISNAPNGPLPASQPAPAAPNAPPPAFPQPNNPAQPFGASDQLSGPASAAPPTGSKPVRTVTIRSEQPAAANPPAAARPPAVHPARTRQPVTKPIRERTPRTASAGPLSIVPNQEGRALPPPPRPHMAMTRPSQPRSSGPMALRSLPAGGGYAVQVSSQRSEAEAQATFRSLQAKYPQQLGGRRAIVRRADLGAKGVYYRALVGPFASAEQAASLCSSLKAAGGNCVIQRN